MSILLAWPQSKPSALAASLVSCCTLHSEPLEVPLLPSYANNALYSLLYKEAAAHVRLRLLLLLTLPVHICHSAWRCLKCMLRRQVLRCSGR